MNKLVYPLFFLLVIFVSCKNETQIKLEEFRESQQIDCENLEDGYDKNVKRNFKNGIEYGIIFFPNNDTVKYWFLSHHSINDGYGGTLFEYAPNKTEFIKGYFCCEIQLPNKGKFEDSKSFLKAMKKLNGIRP